jgi:hypothetical protein
VDLRATEVRLATVTPARAETVKPATAAMAALRDMEERSKYLPRIRQSFGTSRIYLGHRVERAKERPHMR